MPKTFYRKRNKLKPEDWTEEIKQWEKVVQDPYYIKQRKTWYEEEIREKERQERIKYARVLFDWEREKREKRELLDYNGNFCGHYRKGEMDGMIVCLVCGIITGRKIGGSVGYNFKNHIMRGGKKC